jgi:hypothetical protein
MAYGYRRYRYKRYSGYRRRRFYSGRRSRSNYAAFMRGLKAGKRRYGRYKRVKQFKRKSIASKYAPTPLNSRVFSRAKVAKAKIAANSVNISPADGTVLRNRTVGKTTVA